jgi:hypothetical protein
LENFATGSPNRLLAEQKIKNNFDMKTRTLYDDIIDEATERGIQIGEQRGIQLGEQRGESKALQEMICSMWEVHVPMPQIALFTRLKIENIQKFMRQIVGEDKMLLIEQQWVAKLSIADIAGNMNMSKDFITRIVNYVLDYKEEEKKS